jgi:hypothetical protein
MITISSTAQRTFTFPADRKTAFEYYANLDNTFGFLPHISLVNGISNGNYRLVFRTNELGIYQVRVYCDLRAEVDRQAWVLRMLPAENVQPARRETSLNLLSGPGYFFSQSVFKDEGGQTSIDYRLDLKASLPIPLGLSMMPEVLLQAIANKITRRRFNETIDGFIERSLAAYQNHPR